MTRSRRTATWHEPRWETPMPDGVAGSWGPDVEAWAQRYLGLAFDRWQRRVADRALAYGRDGLLLHRAYLASTGRQNGKTGLVRAIVGWALTTDELPAWQVILGLAHQRAQARIPYAAVLADLIPLQRAVGRRPARGGLALTRYLGIRSGMHGLPERSYVTAGREARNEVRGMSTDLVVFDEIRTQRDDETWAAVLPTGTARPEPLLLGITTAGDERSVLLRQLWERGLAIINGAPAEGYGMSWWAPPDEADPDAPQTWLMGNPAFAQGRLPIRELRRQHASLTPDKFRQEVLNLWSAGGDEWLPPGVWFRQQRPQPADAPVRVLGVDVTPDWSRATVAVALDAGDAGAWAGVAESLDALQLNVGSLSPGAVVAAVAQLVAAWQPTLVTWSRAAAIGPHLAAWCEANDRRHHALDGSQLRAASELLRAELVGGRLWHAPDELLRQQVSRARPSHPLQTGPWYFSTRNSRGAIDALRAAAWATWGLLRPPELPETVPQVF